MSMECLVYFFVSSFRAEAPSCCFVLDLQDMDQDQAAGGDNTRWPEQQQQQGAGSGTFGEGSSLHDSASVRG